MALPSIIQGGMGIGVSNWQLARAVSLRGHLGVVSGTAIDSLFVRRLQDGDPGGHLRRAMERFPLPGVAADALKRYFLPDGREGKPYRMLSMYRLGASRAREQITMLASFVETWLAREGHGGLVGINLLTKVQLPNLATLYGAMLAGVDYVLMGAGIPREIPGVLDALAEHRPASLKLDVEGLAPGESMHAKLEPEAHWTDATAPAIRRPWFLPIVSSESLATMLSRKASGRVDGFVVEGPTAGGHNAPPRGKEQRNERGEPIYGERDIANLEAMRELGLPFWLAGGTGSPQALQAALAAGAAGIQVGTLFAYTDESGLTEETKRSVLEHAARGEVDVITDPRASPTGYPFKVVRWPADALATKPARERVCDLGYLRTAYVRPDGRLGYRCAAEPVAAYVEKGGTEEETEGRRCLCNALMANVGHAQVREEGRVEPELITSGDDLVGIAGFLAGRTSYSADEVVDYLEAGMGGAAGTAGTAGTAVAAGTAGE
ncbi:MAG TPA: nitronate monooxygenase [Gemmatimonadales bacterium]|nr:nitronate monooxygenase [Gemmatimonadales bacterium]